MASWDNPQDAYEQDVALTALYVPRRVTGNETPIERDLGMRLVFGRTSMLGCAAIVLFAALVTGCGDSAGDAGGGGSDIGGGGAGTGGEPAG
jgi:hypothetical protein